ncbi:unnamed protein product [Peniophora sp. CBMAI 1063]|nr:unnamed protein product [Peniophora sp. CBMAI 1063]
MEMSLIEGSSMTPVVFDIGREMQSAELTDMIAAILLALQCNLSFYELRKSLLEPTRTISDPSLYPDNVIKRLRDAHPPPLRKVEYNAIPACPLGLSSLLSWSHCAAAWLPGVSTVPLPYDVYTVDIMEGVFYALRATDDPVSALETLSSRKPDISVTPGQPLAWNLWRLYHRILLGIAPPGMCFAATLPVEVLSLIFGFLKDTDKVAYGQPRWDMAAHMPIWLVCKHWRDVLINTPSVWPGIVQGYSDVWTRRALKFSQGAALDIDIGPTQFERATGLFRETTYLLFEDTGRVRSLKLWPQSWVQMSLTSSWLETAHVPQLVSLTIAPAATMLHGYGVSSNIFGGVPPMCLKSVAIADCIINCATFPPFRSSLIHLSLVRCNVWPSLGHLLDTLAALPLLERLEWNMARASLINLPSTIRLDRARFEFAEARASSVALEFLQSLKLHCPTACASAIMRSLSILAPCEVRLMDDYSLSGEEGHDMTTIGDVLRDLESSLGVHVSRPCTLVDGYESYELRINGSPRGLHEHNALTLEVVTEVHAHAQPALALDLNRKSVNIPRCTITLSVFDAVDFLTDEDEQERREIVHRGVMQHVIQSVFAWPSLKTTCTRMVVNHSHFADGSMWLAALRPLLRLSQICIESRGDAEASAASAAVDGLASVLSDQPPYLAYLNQLTLGPHLRLPVERGLILAHSLQKRYQGGGTPVKLVLEDCICW